MKQLLTLIVIIASGCLIAGLYGILHDQLTYTISHEYFTKFKFYQFGFLDKGNEVTFEHPRIQVSAVGFLATWWMGIPVATILGLFSIHDDVRFMLRTAMKAFLVTIIIAFTLGLYGLILGFNEFANHVSDLRFYFRDWYLPENLVDPRHFIAVGSMHNYSYLGGIVGLVGGIIYIVRRKRKVKRESAITSS